MTTPTNPLDLAGKAVVLAARRANDLAAPRYAGETPDVCAGCQAPIMVGPRVRAAMVQLPDRTLVCLQCAAGLMRAGVPAGPHLGNRPMPPEVN